MCHVLSHKDVTENFCETVNIIRNSQFHCASLQIILLHFISFWSIKVEKERKIRVNLMPVEFYFIYKIFKYSIYLQFCIVTLVSLLDLQNM